MGLDMYLSAHKYVGDWNHDAKDSAERKLYRSVTKSLGFTGFRCGGSPHLIVRLNVGYWRKANAIHKWFVDNVQEGVDNCSSYYVDKKKLNELLSLCEKVKETRDASLLPPQSGFFFGSTNIDDWYWQDIDLTIEQLSRVLNDKKFSDWEFYYHSSW